MLIRRIVKEEKRWDREHYLSNEQFIEKMRSKYGDRDDIYIHFSNDFIDSKTQLINTVGLNMKQDYGNPFGIYAYPLNKISIFRSDAKGCYILRNKKNERYIENISEMSQIEYMRCLDILKDKYFTNENEFNDFLKNTEQRAHNKSIGGILFYFIVRLSEQYKAERKPNVLQTEIWRKDLGYTMIGDMSGVIHQNETFQAIWFSSKDFEIVDMNFDKKKNLYLDENLKMFNDDGTWIYNGNIYVSNRGLKSMKFLTGCTSIYGKLNCGNNNFNNFKGMESLTSIDEDFNCPHNKNLISFEGLENLKYIGGGFDISHCESITNFNELKNLKGMKYINDYDCPNLPREEINRLYDQVDKPYYKYRTDVNGDVLIPLK